MKLNKKHFLLLIVFYLSLQLCFAQEKFKQTGLATYYSDVFHGRITSNGEKYDKNLFTAAHATLPFNTYVKVTNLKNDLTVIVKINDRCPKYTKHIIDLSRAAAKKIDILISGVAKVIIEIVTEEEKKKWEMGIDTLKTFPNNSLKE